MENIFADELGHTMLTALKELGEGINKLSLLERNFSNCGKFFKRTITSHILSL